MLRIILGAIAGFIVWLILLRGSDFVWAAWSPDYGRYLTDLSAAVENKTPFTADSTIMLIIIIRSAILTFMAGFIVALIAKENFKSPLFLGILLLALGVLVSLLMWNIVPFWYHLLILLPLIPLSLLGGKLRQ